MHNYSWLIVPHLLVVDSYTHLAGSLHAAAKGTVKHKSNYVNNMIRVEHLVEERQHSRYPTFIPFGICGDIESSNICRDNLPQYIDCTPRRSRLSLQSQHEALLISFYGYVSV